MRNLVVSMSSLGKCLKSRVKQLQRIQQRLDMAGHCLKVLGILTGPVHLF
jgi:hypothetical protein